MIYLFLVFIIVLSVYIYVYFNNNKKALPSPNYTFSGERNKYLLTRNELSFFYKLKNLTDKYKLYIFPKIRLADIINTNNISDFNKISSKHVDFTICDNYCRPILFIELDDNSHHSFIKKEKDIKKDYIFEEIHSNLIRIKLDEVEHKLKYIESILLNK